MRLVLTNLHGWSREDSAAALRSAAPCQQKRRHRSSGFLGIAGLSGS